MVYEGILIELPFAEFFLKKFRSKLCDFRDMGSLDRDVFKNLQEIQKYTSEELTELSLNFTIVNDVFGRNKVIELKEKGKHIPVTIDNVAEYIHRISDYRLNKQMKDVAEAFIDHGFFSIIEKKYFKTNFKFKFKN